jgi:hypothetical protein
MLVPLAIGAAGTYLYLKRGRSNPARRRKLPTTRAGKLRFLSKHHWQRPYATDAAARKNGYAPLTNREINSMLREYLAHHPHRRNPLRKPDYQLADGTQVTRAALRRMFFGKIPGPTHRRLLGITKLKKG